MKKRWGMMGASVCLLALLLTGCGMSNTAADQNTTTETETQTRTDTGSGSGWVDENGEGIIGNDGTGYTEDTGSVTDDVESAADDLGRAVENGAEDVTDGVVGDTQTDRTTTDENTTTKR